MHQVLVTEPVVPLLDPTGVSPFQPRVTKYILRQIFEGFAFIHSYGIAHGDLHPQNFGVAVPEINCFNDLEIWELCSPPRLRPPVSTSPERDCASFPPYLCDTMDLSWFLVKFNPKIVEHPLAPISLEVLPSDPSSTGWLCETPLFYAAPEVVFPRIVLEKKPDEVPWDRCSDIWSLAVALHDLVGAQVIFQRIKPIMHSDWTPSRSAELWQETEEPLASCGVDDPPSLTRLIRRMMVLDPAKQPTAAELLDDPYL
ncbi:kinase-like domain-containing protein [Mycena olivaceomarginata]|nr:kinase-like domain-containing protein [Mycena olivaceomarginata]